MNESILEQLDSQIKAMRELRRKEQKKQTPNNKKQRIKNIRHLSNRQISI